MRFVCTSDTHTLHASQPIPEGDVFIHAGDFTSRGELREVAEFNAFLRGLPHKHKIVVAGNHDFAFERQPVAARALLRECVYLEDAETTVEGVRVWGAPWQPWFMDWAFNLRRGPELKAKWDLIPAGIRVLVTHGPPAGQGDRVKDGEGVGCEELRAAVRRVRPLFHVFGHIHEGYGTTQHEGTTFVNAAMCDERYRPVNPPLVFDL